MDTLTIAERSRRMAAIRGRDTKPEWAIRRLVHRLGYRYRLHRESLPGRPDLVFPGRRKAVFVHGCFWHRHPKCKYCRMPKSRLEFWKPKLDGNRRRDLRKQRELSKQGWSYLVIWECQVSDANALERRLRRFLETC